MTNQEKKKIHKIRKLVQVRNILLDEFNNLDEYQKKIRDIKKRYYAKS